MSIPVSTVIDITKKHNAFASDTIGSKRRALLEIASIIKTEYAIQKSLEDPMAVSPQLLEIMAAYAPIPVPYVPSSLLYAYATLTTHL